jgi:hypothetical protein
MRLFELLQHPRASLPGNWTGNDFQIWLNRFLQDYLDEIDNIDPACVLGQRVRAELPRMNQVRQWLCGAIQRYFDHRPDIAYTDVVRAVNAVRAEVTNLFSAAHIPIGRLYRTSRAHGSILTRQRLFHTSVFDRQYVGSHRYGITGFPCIYVGGSLNVCLRECRIDQPDWHDAAFARFECRREVQVLDFGFRPGFVGRLAQGRALQPGQPPNSVDDFIVRYAVAWPLIAACSIANRYDGKFAVEYVIPHNIVQWLQRENQLDGIRFFSTRLLPTDPNDGDSFYVNYVFPAVGHQGFNMGYSQKLINILSMTDVLPWHASTGGSNMVQEYQETQAALDSAACTLFVP